MTPTRTRHLRAGVLLLVAGGLLMNACGQTDNATRLAQDLSGTWTITSIRTPNALAAPLAGTKPNITFSDGHKVRVATGCNDISTTWKTTGSGVTFEPGMSTLKGCPSPNGVAEQEQQLGDALAATRKIGVSGNTMDLMDGAGDRLVVATRNG